MATYKVVDAEKLDADMTSVADTIRTKGGTTEQLAWPDGYNAAIEAIQTGGGFTPPSTIELDPDEVYRTTRPADWLPMPTPGDDEIYFLCHVRPNRQGLFYVQLGSNGSFAVEYGKMVDGVFVADGKAQNTSSNYYKIIIEPSMCYSPTADGTLQLFVRIKGAITTLNGDVSTTFTARQCAVDAVCGIALTRLQLSNTNDARRSWFRLRYWRFVGNGGASSLPSTFYLCKSLLSVGCEKENVVSGDINNAFRATPGLIAVSPNLIGGSTVAVNANYLFAGCSLKVIKDFRFKCSSAGSMFNEGNAVEVDFANIDTSECTSLATFFYNSYAVRSIKNLNISGLTSIASNWCINCNDLETLTFTGETTVGGITITATMGCLCHAALVEMIDSLPVATTAATVTITGQPGASELTDEEIAVATAKNWTVTI